MTKSKEPKVLVVSNNAFSSTKNNGKTLASFFKSFKSSNIAQLYFYPELPTDPYFKNFYRVTDKDMMNSLILKKSSSGAVVPQNQENTESSKKSLFLNSIIKKSSFVRLGRELVWMFSKWNSEDLDKWVREFSPNIVFLCAGDSGFAYKIARFLQQKHDAKLVIYITDDYILPRLTASPFWWIRRNYILKEMEKTIELSDLFITISAKMSKTYKDWFSKDSIVAVNMCNSMEDEGISEDKDNGLQLVYAGGLHLNRFKTLELLAKCISNYNNKEHKTKVFLKIYSSTRPQNIVVSRLNIKGASKYMGSLQQDELKIELNKCNIPVHVESFDRKSRDATRLSISTKISEYLSLGKPILAIGPKDIASMEYLEDVAFCITDQRTTFDRLTDLLENEELKLILAQRSIEKYNKNHDNEKTLKDFKSHLEEIWKA